ncbi:MAG TPA: tyrosine-type recombinase/integrase [Paraburkholderia sp.]|uniref:tyrosine-type recombinase/integrase n=1 Tax=Paraburkholderia sp. TaxID=1926495 RepID=UPI002BF0C75B|nr:tyrosine-type recombinase/integrase [Paraburkholderia sp.]HTR10908.1 tyrosine-type recombinase/integrase [Paraburkholderia sp.]
MRVRNLAASTQRNYVSYVSAFARHFGRSPEVLGPEEIRAWQLHLVDAQRSRSTLVLATAALRFLYNVTLKRGWVIDEIAMSKKPRKLPVILSPDEVTRLLEAIPSIKYRVILMTAYAGGLRISEATRLKVGDIDSQGMVLRVEQGKGQTDRYVMLSPAVVGDPARILAHRPTLALAVPWPLPRSAYRAHYRPTGMPGSPSSCRRPKCQSFAAGLRRR